MESLSKREVRVYKLLDPDTKVVRYVGSTVGTLNARLSQHKHDAKKNKGTYKTNWLNSIYSAGKTPIIELIETCNISNYEDRETFWIKYYTSEYLTNTRKEAGGIVVDRTQSSKDRSARGHCKPIIQLTPDGEYVQEWPCIRDVERAISCSHTAIGNCLSGRATIVCGYHWIYSENYTSDYTVPYVDMKKVEIGFLASKGVKVQIELHGGETIIFDKLNLAANYLGLTPNFLSCILSDNYPHKLPKRYTNIKSIIKL